VSDATKQGDAARELMALFKLDTMEEGLRILALGAEVPTGVTPKDVVWTRNKTTLYRYRPIGPVAHRTPVLLVYALINKPYVFDLQAGNSFIRHLLRHGYDVFLVDWGTPGWEDRGLTFDELVGEHLPKAVERTRRASGADELTLFGYCMGGTMAGMYAALHPEGIRNLITLTAPFDFADAGTYSVWTDKRYLDPNLVSKALGNVPGDLIDLGNKMLRPVTNYVGATMTMWDRLLTGKDMDGWLAMNKWVNDGVPFPGAAFVQWIGSFYQENRLIRGEMTIKGERVDLSRISMPLLNIVGEADHIVPPPMALPLNEAVSSSDKQLLTIPAGHVGLLVGSGARKGLWPKVVEWLDRRSD
jgi:poly[(R)-3-hydroxyalkanoate] polymerase subunit PhaC